MKETIPSVIKKQMYYTLERIHSLEDIVEKGKKAEEELRELNKKFKELCIKAAGEN